MTRDGRGSARIGGVAGWAKLFRPIAFERVEVAVFVYLDALHRPVGMRQTRSGARDLIDLPLRALAADALALDARALVMAHNHPSGDPTPSAGDIDATRLMVHVLHPLGVQLVDHLVLAGERVRSFTAAGLLCPVRTG